jgi:small subunit ribosomal protein S6
LATAAHEYELVLMLDPETPDERRDSIAQNARGRIESSGSLKAEKAWGLRKLAYEINQRTEADYRFFRFEAPTAVLDDLDHNLKITDGVMRFRIFKVDPRSPVIEPPPPVALASSSSGRGPGGRRGQGRGRDDWDDRGSEAPAPAPAAASAEPQSAPAPAPPAPAAPTEAPADPAEQPAAADDAQ